jgi:hypothetical protein
MEVRNLWSVYGDLFHKELPNDGNISLLPHHMIPPHLDRIAEMLGRQRWNLLGIELVCFDLLLLSRPADHLLPPPPPPRGGSRVVGTGGKWMTYDAVSHLPHE